MGVGSETRRCARRIGRIKETLRWKTRRSGKQGLRAWDPGFERVWRKMEDLQGEEGQEGEGVRNVRFARSL